MTRLTFRFPADLRRDQARLWTRRAYWLQKRVTELNCFIDTNADFAWPFLRDDGEKSDCVLMIPERSGPWTPDPTPDLREWITELGFEIVEDANAN